MTRINFWYLLNSINQPESFEVSIYATTKGIGVWLGIRYRVRFMLCYIFTISTLLFFALLSSVELSVIGFVCPQPLAESRLLSIPLLTKAFITDLALLSESVWFDAAVPTLSVCPSILIFRF